MVPRAVWKEVVEQGRDRPGALEVAAAEWIAIQDATDQGIVRLLETDLEQGEAEAIALAYEKGADVVLLDEHDARHAAKRLGLHVLGTVGVLMWARKAGRIPSLRLALDALREDAGFRIGPALRAQALREVGEHE